MIQSKAWNWDVNVHDYWKNVSEEFFPVALQWKADNYSNILDLGCGIGRNALYLARIGFEVYAFDLSVDGLSQLAKEAELQNLEIKIKNGDMLDLSYGSNFLTVYSLSIPYIIQTLKD